MGAARGSPPLGGCSGRPLAGGARPTAGHAIAARVPRPRPPPQAGDCADGPVLNASRAAQLDQLLNQTDLYTKFLTEQMESIEQKTEAEAAAAAGGADDADAGKRKAGPAKAGGAKKSKSGVSATKAREGGKRA